MYCRLQDLGEKTLGKRNYIIFNVCTWKTHFATTLTIFKEDLMTQCWVSCKFVMICWVCSVHHRFVCGNSTNLCIPMYVAGCAYHNRRTSFCQGETVRLSEGLPGYRIVTSMIHEGLERETEFGWMAQYIKEPCWSGWEKERQKKLFSPWSSWTRSCEYIDWANSVQSLVREQGGLVKDEAFWFCLNKSRTLPFLSSVFIRILLFFCVKRNPS
jgi:hypothetical protein